MSRVTDTIDKIRLYIDSQCKDLTNDEYDSVLDEIGADCDAKQQALKEESED